MKNKIVDISRYEKVKFLLYSLYVAAVICFKNFVFSLWRRPVETTYPDKPMACLVGNGLGNHSYIKINGVKLHYVESGAKHKPLALLLHGFPDCWLGWRRQIGVLDKHFRVVAVDLKGFGDSEKPQWRSQYQVHVLLRELRELISALDETRCFVIGHDLGAMLGWFLAAQYPDLVTKFVAIACPHPNVHWEYLPNADAFNSRFVHLCQMPQLPEAEVRKDNLAMVGKFYSHLLRNGETELLDAYKYVFSRAEDLTGPIHYLRNLPLTRLEPGMVTVPTLLLVGNRDPFIAVESIVRSTAFLEDFQLKMVEGVGHFPHQEDANQVNSLLVTFLLDPPETEAADKTDGNRGLIGSLMTNTFKYGNSIVENVKKTTNGVVWKPQLLKSSG